MKTIKINYSNDRSQGLIVAYNEKLGIVATGICVESATKKFNQKLKKIEEEKAYIKNHAKAMEHLCAQDERETELMIQSTKNLLNEA